MLDAIARALRERNKVAPRALVHSLLALRRGLRRLSDAVVPAEFALLDGHVNGIVRSAVVAHAARLGLFDALLDCGGDPALVATRLSLEPDGLTRLLSALCALGLLRRNARSGYECTRLGRTLRSDAPVPLGPAAAWLGSPAMLRAWASMHASLATSPSPFLAGNGAEVWDWLAQEPGREVLFADAMKALTELTAPAIAAAWPFERAGSLCDVAGGQGTLVAALLRRHKTLRASLCDRPAVLARADAYLRSQGLRERVSLVPGELFASLPAGHDTYLLKDVLHDWDDEACRAILETLRRACATGSRVLVAEDLLGQSHASALAPLADLTMWAVSPGGRQRSAAQLGALLEASRFRVSQVWPTAFEAALVEAVAG